MDSLINIIIKSLICCYVIQSNVLRSCNGLTESFSTGRNSSESYLVKLRGLPWSVTVEDIVNFFDECDIKNGTSGVHLIMTKEGRPSGIAFVEMETEEDMELAYKKDHHYLGDRFIEVFRGSRSEMQRTVRRSEQSVQRAVSDACVRIRGLPFKASEHDVINYFEGLDIIPNGVTLVYDEYGRTTGEAYVRFRDQEVAEKALKRDMGRLHHRYIEVFRSSLGELRLAQMKQHYASQPGPVPPRPVNNYRGYQMLRPLRFSGYPERYSGGEWNGKNPWYNQNNVRQPEPGRARFHEHKEAPVYKSFALHMRGLPFNVTKEDIYEFFIPVVPTEVYIQFNSKGRTTGQAEVVFKNQEDLLEALTKNKNYMKHRYIELYEYDL